MTRQGVIREIGATDLAADLAAVRDLLAEGFPRRPAGYWDAALAALASRPAVPDMPRFGLALEGEGAIQGVILLVSSERGGRVFGNLSSWYVREPWRGHATFLFRRAMRRRDAVYLNLSPAEVVLPIVRAFGFEPYSAGEVLLDPRAAAGSGGRSLGAAALREIGGEEGARIAAHLRAGCEGFAIAAPAGPAAILYRMKRLKQLVPAARILYGDPALILRSAGAVMRTLIRRGYPLALLDIPPGLDPRPGTRLGSRSVRYVKGGPPPAVGDLLDTELALFGP